MPGAISLVVDVFKGVEGLVSTVVKDGVKILEDSPGMQLLSGGTPINKSDIDVKEGTASGITTSNKNTTDIGNIDDPDTEEPKHHKDHKHPKSDDPEHKKDSPKDTTFSFE